MKVEEIAVVEDMCVYIKPCPHGMKHKGKFLFWVFDTDETIMVGSRACLKCTSNHGGKINGVGLRNQTIDCAFTS